MIGNTILSIGKLNSDSRGSSIGHNIDVGSFADRDMVMRYHYGLGIGHTYSHARPVSMTPSAHQPHPTNTEDDASHVDDSEHSTESLEFESERSDLEPDEESGRESDSDSESNFGWMRWRRCGYL